MSSLGRGSAATGSVLFQDGSGNHDDDGEDSNYMFFMNGEVVMRRRPRSPSTASVGEDEPEITPEVVASDPSNAPHGTSLGVAVAEATLETVSESSHAVPGISQGTLQAQPQGNSGEVRNCDGSHQTPRTSNSQPLNNGAAPMRLFPFSFWDKTIPHRRVQPPGSPDQES